MRRNQQPVLFMLVGFFWLGAGTLYADPTAMLEADPSMRTTAAESQSIGGGFWDHGRASHVAHGRGMVSTENAEGQSIVLAWLSGDAILEINVETEEYREHPNPHFSGGPFASILSSDNYFYTVRDWSFVKFDPRTGEFEHIADTEGRNAYSMIEDDDGVIWAGLATEGVIVSYDRRTGEFRDYGVVYERDHRVSPRFLAADDQGWIYTSFGTPSQIVIFDPQTGEARPVIPEEEQTSGLPRLWRGTDGKVYSPGPNGAWYELYAGEATQLGFVPDFEREYGTYKSPMRAHFVSGTQGLAHGDLPNGEQVEELDLLHRRLTLKDPETGQTRVLEFDYEGGDRSLVMAVEATSVDTIAGGATYPGRFFSYNPATDEWTRGDIYRQWNATTTTEDGIFYAGLYTPGVMLEWDPTREWVATEPGNPDSNPLHLDETRAHPHIWRPSDILVYPGDRYVILAGWSSPGQLGGGLSFWDRETRTAEILTHDDLIRYHNAASMAPLPDNQLLVGTTTTQRGGEVRAEGYAKLYILDMETKEIQWQAEAVEGVDRYYDMTVGPDGLVYMIADRREPRLFVFDPEQRAIVHEQEVPREFGFAAWGNAPRVFVPVPDGRIFALFQNVIAQLDPEGHDLEPVAETPEEIWAGGAYLDGRLYLTVDRARLLSWEVPTGGE